MQFGHDNMLHGLWLVILLIAFFVWALKRRAFLLNQFAQTDLVKTLAYSFSEQRLRLKMTLLVGVVILSIVAMARPQWGFEWQEVQREGIDVLVVIDTSKSMLTQDVKPNRLERTKLAIMDLLKELKGDRIGLVAFAGDAFLFCPLTIDYGGFLLSLNDLDVGIVPRGGTNLERAINVATDSFLKQERQNKSVIIITDGDNLEGKPLAAAKRAQENNIKIHTIGIGTKEGELIQFKDGQGNLQFLKDSDGNFVKSRLNEKVLQEVALLTGGVYVKASGAQFGLDYIYDKELSKLEKENLESKMEKRFYERFQIPLALALLLLLIELCLNTRVQKKKLA